jgi:type IV pilus assembly protein PilO
VALKASSLNWRDPSVRTTALMVVVGVLGSLLWYYQFFEPQLEQRKQLMQTLEVKERQLQQIILVKPQLNSLKKEIQSKQLTLDSLRSMFPDQKEIPRLIHEITRLSRETDIYTTRFIPLEDEVQEHYVENNYTIALRGSYHQFAQFLSKLASMQLIVNLSDMRLVALQQSAPAEGRGFEIEHTLSATFKMTTFSSKK